MTYFQTRGNERKLRNKYGVAPRIEREYKGSIYDSKKEAQKAWELDMLKRAKEIKDWERQIPIDIYITGANTKGRYKICTHKVDFLVHHFDGTMELIEIKGFETPDWRIKKKLIEAIFLEENPEYTYTVEK